MPATDAVIGHGLTLEVADPATPTSFTYIAEIFDVAPPSSEIDQIDSTHMASPNRVREYTPGLEEPGEVTASMNFIPGSSTDVFLRGIRGVTKIVKITYKTGAGVIFNGFLMTYTKTAPTGDRMTAELSFKVSGEPTDFAVAAPRSLVAPTISGTEQVGAILTCDPGVFAGAEDVTYQWENDGGTGTWADISGATASTYVLQSTDEGDDIRCVVTGTNDSFSTEATTAETGAIVAA